MPVVISSVPYRTDQVVHAASSGIPCPDAKKEAKAYTLAWLPMHNILKISSDSVIWTMFVMATAAFS